MRVTRLFPRFRCPKNALLFCVLLTSKEIREQIGELTDRASAIVELAESEKRALTDEEKAEIDGILGVGKQGEAGYKPGKIDALQRDLERAEKLEARQAEITNRRNPVPPQEGAETETDDATALRPRAAAIVIPARANFAHASLKAYHGPHARQEAYIAGQFLLGTIFRHEPAAQWCREHGLGENIIFRAALAEGANQLGGFLVPDEMERSIIALRETYGVFRRQARVTAMSGDVKNHPYRKTGVTAYFVGENQEITESEATWGNAKLVAKKIAALVRYSTEVSEDAIISIGDELTVEIAQAFALKEDQCGFLGDGTATYGGIIGLAAALAAGSIYTAIAGNLAFGTLDLADFESMVGKLPDYAGINPAWYISKAGWAASMLRLMDAAGGNTVRELSSGDGRMQFLGYPVVWSGVLNKTLTDQASTRLLYFGDLAMSALLGNRRGMSIAISDQRWFAEDQIGIKGTERFDITVHSVGDATNPGAMIGLTTPAA